MDIADPREEVIASFPELRYSRFRLSSPKDSKYNCIAWAAGRDKQWWWPTTFFWPHRCARVETIEAFVAAFRTVGYEMCKDTSREKGYEKVALYAVNGKPKHAARQLRNGKWTSKLGASYDIEHDSPESLAGRLYGSVVCVLKRRRQ